MYAGEQIVLVLHTAYKNREVTVESGTAVYNQRERRRASDGGRAMYVHSNTASYQLRFDVHTAVCYKNHTIYTSYAQQVHITWYLMHVTVVYGSGGYVVRAHTASGCCYTVQWYIRYTSMLYCRTRHSYSSSYTYVHTPTVRRVPLFLNVTGRQRREFKSPSLIFCFFFFLLYRPSIHPPTYIPIYQV